MKLVKSGTLLGLLLGAASLAFAGAGSVTIKSPADRAKLKVGAENKVEYEIDPGPNGDHFHMYVNGKEDVVRSLKGSYALSGLKTGENTITLKVVDKGHTPVGIEKTIKVIGE
ncbi:MAG: hypothetical protein HY028_11090 [Gammaproteobacteria bacterium]|nr:hypothetical protein [Gammaproteobacteria bacterium]